MWTAHEHSSIRHSCAWQVGLTQLRNVVQMCHKLAGCAGCIASFCISGLSDVLEGLLAPNGDGQTGGKNSEKNLQKNRLQVGSAVT